MALSLSLSSTSTILSSNPHNRNSNHRPLHTQTQNPTGFVKCLSSGESSAKKLEIGSPVIVVEAPKMIKTAASVPCLRVNSGLVNPGDVGRIVSRKPKDVWAVRLSIGTYLLDAKYFKPLELDQSS